MGPGIMNVKPLEDVISELEYDEPCVGCGLGAEWSVWLSHAKFDSTSEHRERNWLVCESHRARLEDWSSDCVQRRMKCCCGSFTFHGQLSDHFRAIRL